ncbi:hypothetical protein ACWA1C_04680 [Flectobacillus roseus]|jgi:hypothetical protein|nr:hypothetical protein [Emticicia sp. ODNR4P]
MKNLFKPILLLTIPAILILVVTFPRVLESFMSSVCIVENSQFTNEDRGTFGDMYGVLNSFLSGLSIIGIVLTLYWDKKQEVDKEEKANIDRMSYLYSVCQKANAMLQQYQLAFTRFNEKLNENPFNIPQIKVGSSTEILKIINEKIDQEAYFHSYKSFYNDEQILDLFNHYSSIEVKVRMTLEDIEKGTNYDYERRKQLLLNFDTRIGELRGWAQNPIKDDFIQLARSIISSFDKLDVESKSDAWIIYNTLSEPIKDYLNMPYSNNNDFIEAWRVIKNQVFQIEENNKELVPTTESYNRHITACLKEIAPILEKINTRKVSNSESSFWYFFHGKPKTH